MTWERQRYYDREEGWKKGREEGIQIGMQQGLQRGMENMAKETARNFLLNNTPAELVAKCTGLSLTEVQALESELVR